MIGTFTKLWRVLLVVVTRVRAGTTANRCGFRRGVGKPVVCACVCVYAVCCEEEEEGRPTRAPCRAPLIDRHCAAPSPFGSLCLSLQPTVLVCPELTSDDTATSTAKRRGPQGRPAALGAAPPCVLRVVCGQHSARSVLLPHTVSSHRQACVCLFPHPLTPFDKQHRQREQQQQMRAHA